MKINEEGRLVLANEQELVELLAKQSDETAKKTREAIVKEFKLDTPGFPEIISAAVSRDAEGKKRDKIVKFFRALYMRDDAALMPYREKALSEGTDTAGGFLVPEEFVTDMIYAIEQYNVARSYSTVVPMKSDTKNLASVSTKPTAYWPGESSQITASNIVIARPILTAKKIAGITAFSSELFEDETGGLIQNLIKMYAEALGGEEDNEWFNGDGTNFTGIFSSSGTVDTTLGGMSLDSDLTFLKVMELIHSLSPGQIAGGPAKFFMHRTILEKFRGIADSQGRPILIEATAGMPPSILGYAVVLSEKGITYTAAHNVATKDFVVFGNPKPWVYFGDRKAVTTKILEEATVGSDNLGEKDMLALRVVERVAEVVAVAANVAVMKTAAA